MPCKDGFQACKEKLAEHCREHRQNVCPPIRTPADLFPPGVPHPDAQPHDPPNYYKPPWERGMDDPEKIQVLEKFRAHMVVSALRPASLEGERGSVTKVCLRRLGGHT